MIWCATEYLRDAGETVQCCVLSDNTLIFVHFENGYYSIIEGVKSLYKFLSGDTSERIACLSDDRLVEVLIKSIEDA